MQTVDFFERAVALAEKFGYRVRWESLMGTPGGACEFAGQRWIFLDLTLDTDEQLEQLFATLREITGWGDDELARRIISIPVPHSTDVNRSIKTHRVA